MATEETYIENAVLDGAYMLFVNENEGEERMNAFYTFLNVLAKRIHEGAVVPAPFTDVENTLVSSFDPDSIKSGDQIVIDKTVRLKMDTMTGSDGSLWIPLFINDRSINRGETANIHMSVPIIDILRMGIEREDVVGVVIDPFGKATTFEKDILNKFLGDYEKWEKDMEAKRDGGNR